MKSQSVHQEWFDRVSQPYNHVTLIDYSVNGLEEHLIKRWRWFACIKCFLNMRFAEVEPVCKKKSDKEILRGIEQVRDWADMKWAKNQAKKELL